jgi:mono/diheme cytochrome c family protein
MPENLLSFCALLALAAQLAWTAATFNRDIAPILYKECSSCHHSGEVAPFPLITYQDAVRHAPTIAAVTQRRTMPPWKAEPGPHFKGERRLTDEQIASIGEWATHGMPEGDPSDRPVPPAFPVGWKAGQPDQVFTMPAAF